MIWHSSVECKLILCRSRGLSLRSQKVRVNNLFKVTRTFQRYFECSALIRACPNTFSFLLTDRTPGDGRSCIKAYYSACENFILFQIELPKIGFKVYFLICRGYQNDKIKVTIFLRNLMFYKLSFFCHLLVIYYSIQYTWNFITLHSVFYWGDRIFSINLKIIIQDQIFRWIKYVLAFQQSAINNKFGFCLPWCLKIEKLNTRDTFLLLHTYLLMT